MSNFSLYASLSKDVKDKKLSKATYKDLIEKLQQLDNKASSVIISIIVDYAIDNDGFVLDLDNFSLPYDVKQKGSSVEFDLKKIPDKLQRILLKFTKIDYNS
jgi:hypothetical protein